MTATELALAFHAALVGVGVVALLWLIGYLEYRRILRREASGFEAQDRERVGL